ncbi:MAG: type II secretion system F family protein [bacterium]
MAEFLYKATDKSGKFKTGVISADDIQSAREELKKQQLLVKEIKATEGSTSLNNLIEKLLKWLNRITLKDKVFFTRQLATIINAGIPLLRALYIQEKQTSKKKFKSIISRVISDLESGKDFSQALAQHPDVFDDFYISLVKAGEVSGSLDETLERLAEQLEKTQTLVRKIKSAIVLPAFTVVIMIGVIIVMLIFVIPVLSDLFRDEGVQLPIATRILIFLSDFLLNYWYILLAGTVVGTVSWLQFIRTEKGKSFYDKWRLKPPIFGPLIVKIYLARFARNLGTMLKDGVPIMQAIRVVANTLTNVHYRQSVLDLIPQIEKGKALSKAASKDPNFPFILVQMINVGEESGAIDQMLLRIAIFYEEEIDTTIKNLTTLLEPFMIIGLAVGIGFVGVAILGPIYGLVAVI